MKKLTQVLLPLSLVCLTPALLVKAAETAATTDTTEAAVTTPAAKPGIDQNAVIADTTVATVDNTQMLAAASEAAEDEKLGNQPAVKEESAVEETNKQQQGETAADATAATDIAKAGSEPDAGQLLEFIDSLRGYQDQSFTFDLSNISYKDNEQKHRNKLAVKVLSDASLVEFTAPARSKGRKILKQSQNMWIRFPGTRNVLRISPAQRLLGEASNGDVTGTNFSQDYTASYEGTQMQDDKQVIKLKLVAKHDKTTYKQVMFYLDSENNLPLRSDFYARSGKLAKQAYYTMFKEFDGDLKLHRMKLVDPIVAGSYTWMMFDNYQKQELDAAIFHKDALTR